MSRKKLILVMILTAILLGALALITNFFPDWLSSILAFPLEPVFRGLEALAETGRIGNGAAVMLSAALVLLPLFFALRMRGKDKIPEILSLILLSGIILLALYGARNPGVFQNRHLSGDEAYDGMIRMGFSLSVWGVVILHFVLRLIRLFRAGHREQLLRYLRCLLYALCLVFSGAFAVHLVSGILTLVKGLPTAEDAALHTLKALVALVTSVLNIAVGFRMLDLLDSAATEEQEGLAEAAARLSRTSCIALACTAAFSALVNIAQLFLLKGLTDAKVTADIPLADIVYVLTILLLSRLLTENKQLKDDNSMFI